MSDRNCEMDFGLFVDDEEEDEKLFTLATAHVTGKTNAYATQELLDFYGLYKQATEGPCSSQRPSMLQVKARAKWSAWQQLGDMSATAAQRGYIDKLKKLEPNWPECIHSKRTMGLAAGWVVHSIESAPSEDLKPEHEKTVFDYAKEQNLSRLREMFVPADLLLQDEHGMGLVHWATDRNAVEILEFLIQQGVDINQRDGEQQTPLHYAASCGHVEALQFLLKHKADMQLLDADNQSCLDVADDQQITAMLHQAVNEHQTDST